MKNTSLNSVRCILPILLWTVAVVNTTSFAFSNNYPVASRKPFQNATNPSSAVDVPTTFLSFKGNQVENTILLEWVTIAGKNTGYMAVERSSDGAHFVEIGWVKPDHHYEIHQYNFTDHHPLAGTNYYRLRQVTLDGEIIEHQALLMIDFQSVTHFEVNLETNLPQSDEIKVLFDKPLPSKVFLSVVDMNGSVLELSRLKEGIIQYSVDISQYAQGYYVIKIQTSTFAESIRFMKQ